MQRLVTELVTSSYELARLLLHDGEHAQPDACAAAVVPLYPFPPKTHPSWQTADGHALHVMAVHGGMSIDSMHESPGLAARVLFDAEWRRKAAKACRARVCLVQDVVHQFCDETGCDAPYARLQLAAATKVHADELDDGHMYVTRCNDGCVVLHGKSSSEQPSEPTFVSMQADLSLPEQLEYLMTSNDMLLHFSRAAQGEPLPLSHDVCTYTMPPLCLAFCSICSTNWCVDCDGQFTTLLRCQHRGCSQFVHRTCLGKDKYWCPKHAKNDKHGEHAEESAAQSGADDVMAVSPTLAATGLVSYHGAWCVAVAEWPGVGPCFGCLHPLCLEHLYAETDRRLALQQWQAPGPATSAKHGKLQAVLRMLHKLGHRLCTAGPSLSHPPKPTKMAQRVLPTHAWQLSPGVGKTLCALQVYPDFHTMCLRFLRAGATLSTLDHILAQWMHKRLPLLTGTLGNAGTASTQEQAHVMHEQAWAAILSPRVIDRCNNQACYAEHWVATQVDPVYPQTAHEDAEAMIELELIADISCVPVPLLPAKPRADLSHKQMREPVSTYPVHVMLSPSRHLAALSHVLQQMSTLDADKTLRTFLTHEIAPFQHVTQRIVREFRKRCILDSSYGKVYLFMIAHGTAADGSACYKPDSTGLLPVWQSAHHAWKAKWDPVCALCECTNATYVGFECGSAAYWRRVLPGRRAFLFEIDAFALHELASVPLPSSVHVVPVRPDDSFSLQEVDAKCVVLTRRTWPRPNVSGCVVHDLTPGKTTTSAFMSQFRYKPDWQHDTTALDDQLAVRAYRMMY